MNIEAHVNQILRKPRPKSNCNITRVLYQRHLGRTQNLIFKKSCVDSVFCTRQLEMCDGIPEVQSRVSAIKFHHDGEIIASANPNLTIDLWHWQKGKLNYSYKSLHILRIQNITFLNLLGGIHIVTTGADGQVRYQHIAEDTIKFDKLLTRYKGSSYTVTSDKSQPQVVISCGNFDIRRNDLRISSASGCDIIVKHKNVFYHHDNNPANFHELIVCSHDNLIRMFDQRNAKLPVRLYSPFCNGNTFPASAFYNHDGSELLGTYREGIYLFQQHTQLNHHSSCLRGMKVLGDDNKAKFFGSQSRYVVCGSECGNIFVWSKDTGAIIQCVAGDKAGRIVNVECHPKEPYLCSIGYDNGFKIWMPKREDKGTLSHIVRRNILESL